MQLDRFQLIAIKLFKRKNYRDFEKVYERAVYRSAFRRALPDHFSNRSQVEFHRLPCMVKAPASTPIW